MAHLATPITPPLGWAPRRSKPRATANGLLPLLKVRVIHAVLVALLVDLERLFQMTSGLSDRPRLLVEVFFGMIVRNVWFWIIGFVIIAVVQVKIEPGRTRRGVLLLCVLVLISVGHVLDYFWHSTYIVVELGLATFASMVMQGLWTNTTYLLLAVWYYESTDRAQRSTATQRRTELVRRSTEGWLLELRLGSPQARLDP